MDWSALRLSLELAFWTCLILVPMAVLIGRGLASTQLAAKPILETFIALPLVLPPTVLGFYLLVAFGAQSQLGGWYQTLTGRSLVFSFDGLLLASIVFNLPFAVQPVQRAFESIPVNLREAAWCCGLSRWQTLRRIELPLAWPGIISAVSLTFAHTLGEFGVVLMVGGNIPQETRTVAIAIYDRTQAFDDSAAASMAALLLVNSFLAIGLVYLMGSRWSRRYDG